jgi:hypothetical protein
MFTGFSPSQVKLPRCDVDHSLSSGAEVNNEWSYISASPVCLHDVDTDNFTFFTVSAGLWDMK